MTFKSILHKNGNQPSGIAAISSCDFNDTRMVNLVTAFYFGSSSC
jgi:hypothetical protein